MAYTVFATHQDLIDRYVDALRNADDLTTTIRAIAIAALFDGGYTADQIESAAWLACYELGRIEGDDVLTGALRFGTKGTHRTFEMVVYEPYTKGGTQCTSVVDS